MRQYSLPEHAGYRASFGIRQPAQRQSASISPRISLELATLAEPLAVALHSMKFAAMHVDDTVAVFGAGPIGLLTVACLKIAGVKRIWAVDPVPHRRELAKLMAPMWRSMPPSVASDPDRYGGRGVDCAIDCAAKQHTTNDAIRAVRNAGRVVITESTRTRTCRLRCRHAAEGTRGVQRAPLQ